jgi:hypothetical protein
MSLTVDQFVHNWNNKQINNGGIQCVAVGNQYQKEVIEGGWIGTPLTGWATDWWTNFGNDSDYDHYIRIGADHQPQKGDLAIWNKYNGNGLPHIALVLENQGGHIKCFTQNPGKARIESLTKNGIIGYLRPKKFIQAAPAPAPAPAPAAAPVAQPAATGQTLHLPASATSWRVYPTDRPATIGNESGRLNPSLFGGLQYAILGTPYPNVVTIQTRDFGTVNIYVGAETGASIR